MYLGMNYIGWIKIKMNTAKILTIMCMVLISLNFVSAVTIQDVTSAPEEVAPGAIVDVTLKVENIFDYDVTNVNVRLILSEESSTTSVLGTTETQGTELPFAPYQSSSEDFIEELDSEEDENFHYRLITLPTAASGIYKIPVEITYVDANDVNQSKNDLISLIVNSEPELKVSVEDSVLIKGQENSLSIKIVNSGLADVKFVYANLNDVSGAKFICEKEQYIGDIDSDDFDSVACQVFISETSSGEINVPVVLKFKDATNKEFVETKTVTLRTYDLKKARELGLVPSPSYTNYIVIAVLIVGYFIYRFRKKRKLKKRRS